MSDNDELAKLKKEVSVLKLRLKKAEECIDFYADIEYDDETDLDDIEEYLCKDDRILSGKVPGRLARENQKNRLKTQ